jgi:hypothetical protein
MDGEQIRQAAPGELVDNRQHAECPTILRPVLDDVIGPDMPSTLRSQTDARSIIQPETAALWLFLRHFKPLRRQIR